MEQNGWFRLESNPQNNNRRRNQQQNPRMPNEQQNAPRTQETRPRVQNTPNTTSSLGPGSSANANASGSPVAPTASVTPRITQSNPQISALDPYQDGLKTKHSQTVGARGPVLVQDGNLHEILETFVNTKIIERAVHVKGFGAFGHFQPYQSMKEHTMLDFLQDPSRKTSVACRFSLAVSTKGTPDTSRNVRGLSTKFYTQQGVFDLLCNHILVFLVRDAIRFTEAIKSLSPSPINNLIDPTRFWNFISRAPEATHFVTWLYSDVETVKSLRHIRAYGVNTYIWKNADNMRKYVKYHWIPLAGQQSIDRQEAERLAGSNPDIAGQDLYNTIAKGTPVEFELCVQLMNPSDENDLQFDPLDDTKTWDESKYPLMPVGRLTLNRNPDNYDAQVEKIAFSPANLLEGAELSSDKILQGRSFIYWDAQRRRIGPDFRALPINAQKDWIPGTDVTSGNGTFVEGTLMRSALPKQDDFTQAGQHYDSLSETQKEHLVDNIASELYAMPQETKSIVMGYFAQASQEFAQRLDKQMAKYQNG